MGEEEWTVSQNTVSNVRLHWMQRSSGASEEPSESARSAGSSLCDSRRSEMRPRPSKCSRELFDQHWNGIRHTV